MTGEVVAARRVGEERRDADGRGRGARDRARGPEPGRDAAVPDRGRREGLGGPPAEVPLPRPAPARDDGEPREAERRDVPDPAGPPRGGLPRGRDADPDEVDARRGARLPRPVARPPGRVLRPPAVAAALQAAPDGLGHRALLPDRPLLPRRGPARRPAARVHAGRHRDVVPRRGDGLRPHREDLRGGLPGLRDPVPGALPADDVRRGDGAVRHRPARHALRPGAEDARRLGLAVGDPPLGREGEGDRRPRRRGLRAEAPRRPRGRRRSSSAPSGLVWIKLQADLPGGWNSNAKKLLDDATVAAAREALAAGGRRPPPRRGGEDVDRQRRPREPPRPGSRARRS